MPFYHRVTSKFCVENVDPLHHLSDCPANVLTLFLVMMIYEQLRSSNSNFVLLKFLNIYDHAMLFVY
jgi:hypothetical protein